MDWIVHDLDQLVLLRHNNPNFQSDPHYKGAFAMYVATLRAFDKLVEQRGTPANPFIVV